MEKEAMNEKADVKGQLLNDEIIELIRATIRSEKEDVKPAEPAIISKELLDAIREVVRSELKNVTAPSVAAPVITDEVKESLREIVRSEVLDFIEELIKEAESPPEVCY